MRLFRIGVIAVAVALAATGAFAMFRAADMVVIPTAAANPGLNSSIWRTDLDIMNVDSVAVDVEIVLLQCCGIDNVTWYQDIKNHLGGRTEDGFGHVDAQLKDIQPGQAVYLPDVVKTNWGDNIKGALLVFGYEAGTLNKVGSLGGVPRLIIAQARTYSLGANADGTPMTYGTQVPGLPWHDYVDPGQKTNGLDKAVFIGLTENTSYRTSVGIINVSDRLTAINVTLTLNAADGTKIADANVQMSPLAVEQYDQAIINLFGKTAEDAITGATLTVTVPLYLTTAQIPAPALMAYVTRMDNVTNDPVYLEQSFTQGFPWACIFNGTCPPKFTAQGMGVQAAPRPRLRPPTLSQAK